MTQGSHSKLRICILGAGKVGRSLYLATHPQNIRAQLIAARSSFDSLSLTHTSIVIIAVRDNAISNIAERLVQSHRLPRSTVVVHCAGALDASVLDSIRPYCAGVAQMHPMISFADRYRVPSLEGAHVHIQGDEQAVRKARTLCQKLGMTPRTFTQLNYTLYHAAAGLVANGAAALAAAGSDLLEKSGVPHEHIAFMLGPLLRSVAENIERLGLPYALTGPVRRGDAQTIRRHIETLKHEMPNLVPLYIECAKAQFSMIHRLHEQTANTYEQVRKTLIELEQN